MELLSWLCFMCPQEGQQSKLQLPSKHGSLDRAYKRGEANYGSLDRKHRRHRGNAGMERRGQTPPLHLDLTPAYGGGEGDLTHRGDLVNKPRVQLQVYHEKFHYTPDGAGGWREVRSSTPSGAFSPESGRLASSSIPHGYDTYSPRLTETAYRGGKGDYPPPRSPIPVPVLHLSGVSPSNSPTPLSPTPPLSASSSTLVTVSRNKPHMEVTKPYETSDFYKYSERLRKQRMVDICQRQLMGGVVPRSGASTPSSENSDSHSLHSSHSGSSLSHSMRLAAQNFFGKAGDMRGSGGKGGGPHFPSSSTSTSTLHIQPQYNQAPYHRQDSDQSAYSSRGSSEAGTHRDHPNYSSREALPFNREGNQHSGHLHRDHHSSHLARDQASGHLRETNPGYRDYSGNLGEQTSGHFSEQSSGGYLYGSQAGHGNSQALYMNDSFERETPPYTSHNLPPYNRDPPPYRGVASSTSADFYAGQGRQGQTSTSHLGNIHLSQSSGNAHDGQSSPGANQ